MVPGRLIPSALLVGLLATASITVLAHSGATGVVKERMDLMKGIGERMKTLSQMFKNELPYEPAKVKEAAGYIGSHGGGHITELFPAGSLDAPSEALPAIWQDWSRFEGLSQQLVAYADALVAAADNPRAEGGMAPRPMREEGPGLDPEVLADMTPVAAFLHLARTCSSCHTEFRVEEQ